MIFLFLQDNPDILKISVKNLAVIAASTSYIPLGDLPMLTLSVTN